jgi:hypothetical protein
MNEDYKWKSNGGMVDKGLEAFIQQEKRCETKMVHTFLSLSQDLQFQLDITHLRFIRDVARVMNDGESQSSHGFLVIAHAYGSY